VVESVRSPLLRTVFSLEAANALPAENREDAVEHKPAPPENKKTVLVVDSHVLVRQLLAEVLIHGDGYDVLMAETGEQGLRQSGEFKGEIHLLITDFQMAGMSGIELATAMTVHRPKLKVLMMSGFPEGMLVLNEGWHFLPKPFVASQMRTLVSGLLTPDKKSRFAAPVSTD
jgi:DNA-binding NtrC family response regulator